MSSSTEKICLEERGFSMKEKHCGPANDVQVCRVTAAPGVYSLSDGTGIHSDGSGIQGGFVGSFSSLCISFLFFWSHCVDLAQTLGDT